MPLRHGAERPCTRDNLQGRLEQVGSQRGGCLELGVAGVHRRFRSWTGCPSKSKGRILHEAAKKDLGKGGIGHAESSSRAQHSGEHLREETERSRTAPGQGRIANIAFYELCRYCPGSGHRGRLGGVRWIRQRKPAFDSGSSSWSRADRGTSTSRRADGTSPADCANSAADDGVSHRRIHNVGFRPVRSDPATLAAG
jgi:hypothetical protein